MTTYSISTDAQALFPDGMNDAMTLFNQGPWTIYLDDNSSIGAQSIPLKPSTTMVWPAGRALWVKGNTPPAAIDIFDPFFTSLNVVYNSSYQNSTLVATRGEYAISGQYSGKALYPIRKSSYTDSISNVSRNYSTDYPFECDSYNSIVITITDLPFSSTSAYTAGAAPSMHCVLINWFDDYGNTTATDEYILAEMNIAFTGSTTKIPQRIVTDVKGRYAVISHTAGDMTQAFSGAFAWTVQGSTTELPNQSHHWIYSVATDATQNFDSHRVGYSPIWLRNLFGIAGTIGGSEHVSIFNMGPQQANNIYLNNVSRKLQLSIRAVSISTATNIHVHSSDATVGSTPGLVQTITAPVGTGTLGPFTMNLPISAFNWISVGAGSGGTFHLMLNWS